MGPICNFIGNKPLSSWAQNIPCPLVYHVSLNFVIHIAHCFVTHHHNPTFHYLSYANHTPTTNPPYHFNKPPTTYSFPLPTPHIILTNHRPPTSSLYQPPRLLYKYGAPTQHFPKPPK